MAVLIRWRRKGILIRDGLAYERHPGDEDQVEPREAQSRVRTGEVEIQSQAIPVVASQPMAETNVLNRNGMEGLADELDRPGDRQGILED